MQKLSARVVSTAFLFWAPLPAAQIAGLLSDLFSDRLQLVFENGCEREESFQSFTAVVLAVGAGRDPARRRAQPDRVGRGVGRARPFSRGTTVADAHLCADILGAELLSCLGKYIDGRYGDITGRRMMSIDIGGAVRPGCGVGIEKAIAQAVEAFVHFAPGDIRVEPGRNLLRPA